MRFVFGTRVRGERHSLLSAVHFTTAPIGNASSACRPRASIRRWEVGAAAWDGATPAALRGRGLRLPLPAPPLRASTVPPCSSAIRHLPQVLHPSRRAGRPPRRQSAQDPGGGRPGGGTRADAAHRADRHEVSRGPAHSRPAGVRRLDAGRPRPGPGRGEPPRWRRCRFSSFPSWHRRRALRPPDPGWSSLPGAPAG